MAELASTQRGYFGFGIKPSAETPNVEYKVNSSRSPERSINIEEAVYSQIQAIRALGRSDVNTLEIAQALGLNAARVNRAIHNLQSRGVRIKK